ncbi:MAG: extracellular solute-binding protein, partial [Ktedonobacterales bacterium]
MLSFFVAACGTSSSTSATDFSGTVVIWHGWQGDYLKAKQDIFDSYTKLHPNVKIQLVHQDNVVDKSITAINAGSGPDMIAWVDDSLGKLAKSKIVIPMDQ